MKVYEYVVMWEPTKEQARDGERAEIIVDPKVILASDDQAATLLAGRAIPEDRIGDLPQITVVVRPF